MIGLSLSFCVWDIVQEKPVEVLNGFKCEDSEGSFLHPHYVRWVVNEPNVSLIVAGTRAKTEEDWHNLLQQYSRTYWRKAPGECVEVANFLKRNGRIVQPRITDPDLVHTIGFGHWVSRQSLITPSMVFPMTPEVEEWWLSR